VRAERQALARNMSAPPSMTLTFVALASDSGARGDSIADGTGLSHVCRLDLGSLLPGRQGNAAAKARSPEECLRMAYPYARAELERRTRPTRTAYAHARSGPVEVLADELRDFAATISLADAGVPSLGLLLPTHGVERAVEASLCRTLAILARQRGSVFLRDADPLVWPALDGRALDLWAPFAATAGPA
jgi:hypothetical protein